MKTSHWILSGILLVLALSVATVAFWASQRSHPQLVRVGVLQLTDVDVATYEGFRAGMEERGYREGETISYVYHGPAQQAARLGPMIDTLLDSEVDLIFVSSTPATQAVKHAIADTSIPAVFAPVNDPVKAGVVDSLTAPGGNLTGIRLPIGDTLRMEKLLQLIPTMKVVWLPYSAADASANESLAQAQQAADLLGLELRTAPLQTPAEIDPLLQSIPEDIDAIYLPRDSTIESRIEDFVTVSRDRRLPLCTPSLTQVEAGALVSYGFVHPEIGRQAARLAAQILRGIPAGELPVETAQNYLAINLRTARDIGVEIPPEMLRQADILVR